MPDLKNLIGRLDEQFAGFQEGVEQFQADAKQEYEARELRFREQFVPAAKRITDVARPRLELLIERFGQKVDVKPTVAEHLRSVTLKFDSPLARIDLTFRVSHDAEVKNLVLDQELELLPILMEFEKHASLAMPLTKIDEGKIAKWFDDRIVSFVQTIAAVHKNQYYLKDHLVTDPVAGVQFPKYAAISTLESGGRTYYFISEETKTEFAKQHKIASK